MRAVAKGVRKTTSKFGARLEPMSHVRLLLYQGRDLDIVSQAESVEPLAPLLATLDRASQAMAVLEAVDQLALERSPTRSCTGCSSACCARSPVRTSAAGGAGVLLEAAGGRGPAAGARRLRALRRIEPEVTLVAFDLDEGGATAVPVVPFGHRDPPAALALTARRSSAAGSTRRSPPPSPRPPRGGLLATRALEHHLERRLRTSPCSTPNATESRGSSHLPCSRVGVVAVALAGVPATDLEQIVNLCKRRGFVYPSAEIYGGFRSAYDYGPLGALMLRNVKEARIRSTVQSATTSS